jgi:DNA-binding SARP family transcriptional activator
MMRIDVWGALRVTHQGRLVEARDFPGLKPKQLFEMLVLERGHAVSKSRLAEALWGEALPQNYLATLETYVSVLRQTLDPGRRARDSVVVTERSGYRLDAQRVTVDLDEFDRLIRDAAEQDLPAALDTMNCALALVRGEVLEDEGYASWADQVRSTYLSKQVHVLVNAGRLSITVGEAAAALRLAQRAVELDPFAEPAYQVLMSASYAMGRQDDALRAYDRFQKLLADELGADPMDETVALHLAILRHQDVSALMPRTPRESPRAPQEARPAAGSLLGRHEEMRRLEDGVAQALEGRFTLMLVVGDSGSGKTHLIDELSARVSVPVGRNRCSDLEAQLPYVALSLALRRWSAPRARVQCRS